MEGLRQCKPLPLPSDLPFALVRWSTVYMGCTSMLSTPAAADLLACSRSLQRVAQLTGPHGWRQGCWQEASPWLHLLVSDLSALGGGPPPPVPYLPSGGLAVTIGNAAVTCQPAAASASMFSCVLMLCYTTWDFDIPNGIVVVTVLSLLVLLLLLMMSASRQRERAGNAFALYPLMTFCFRECPAVAAGTSVLLMSWQFHRTPISITQQARSCCAFP